MARESLLSLEAGLIGLLLFVGILATFGGWFNLLFAYVLAVASVIAGLFGLHWGHQASHSLRRDPRLGGRAQARMGAVLALVAMLGSAYATGLLFLMIHPVAWTFWIALGIALLPGHFGRKAGEVSFLRALDAESGTSKCARCGDRIAVEDGRWTEDRWVCLACGSAGGT